MFCMLCGPLERCYFGRDGGGLFRKVEVGEHDVPGLVHQNVLGLQVPVDEPARVQVPDE